MKLLKSNSAWSRWVAVTSSVVNTTEEPREFPCFGYLVAHSFGYKEESALYLYREDLARMLNQVKGFAAQPDRREKGEA